MSYHPPRWLDIEPSEANKKSIEKAKCPDMTPLKLDSDSGYAEFSSRHDNYCTTLERCTTSKGRPCGGGFPCKHMYRLAMELGLFPGEYRSDFSKVQYQRFGIPLEDVIARAESVSLDSQRFLSCHLLTLRNGPLPKRFCSDESIPELLDANLLIRIDDPPEIRMHPDIDKNSFKLYVFLVRKLYDISYNYRLRSATTGEISRLLVKYGYLSQSYIEECRYE